MSFAKMKKQNTIQFLNSLETNQSKDNTSEAYQTFDEGTSKAHGSMIRVINQQSINPFDNKKRQSVSMASAGKKQPTKQNILRKSSVIQRKQKKMEVTKQSLPQLPMEKKESMKTPPMAETQILTDKISINYQLEPCRVCEDAFGQVKASAHNVHPGLLNKVLLESVTALGDLQSHGSHKPYSNASFYGLYSGSGGRACMDYVHTHLHINLLNHPLFPSDPSQALIESFKKTDDDFLQQAQSSQDNSGASATVILVIDSTVYMASIGNVKAHLSLAHGSKKVQLNQTHTLDNPKERERVLKEGGSIEKTQDDRVYLCPGGLTTTRSFGRLFSKKSSLGGNPNLVLTTPQLKQFSIYNNYDYILLTNQGISCASMSDQPTDQVQSIIQPADLVQSIIQHSLQAHALMNLSCLLICFPNFGKKPSIRLYKDTSQKLIQSIGKQKRNSVVPSSKLSRQFFK